MEQDCIAYVGGASVGVDSIIAINGSQYLWLIDMSLYMLLNTFINVRPSVCHLFSS